MRRVFKSDVHSYCEYPTSAIYRFLSILWTLSDAVHSYWQDSEARCSGLGLGAFL